MDTTRWKSILVPREVYDEIRAISAIENRSIGGQLRTNFESWKDENLTEDKKYYVKVTVGKLQAKGAND
jgi:hypothetical protein